MSTPMIGPCAPWIGDTTGEDAMTVVTLDLDAAALRSLADAPLELLAAPGAGNALVVDWAVGLFTPGATPYMPEAQASWLGYGDDSFTTFLTCVNLSAIVEQVVLGGLGASSEDIPSEKMINQPIKLFPSTTVDPAGDGTARITLSYRVVSV